MVTQPSRLSAAAVVAVAIAIIATVTLQPAPASNGLPFFCVFCGTLGGVDFVLNSALFGPLGLGLFWLLGSRKAALVVGVATTLTVELLQWRFVPGRDAALGDLLANGLGVALGIGVALVGATWLKATGRLARRLAAAFAVTSALLVMLSTWLLQPVRVRYPLAVQWKPVRADMDDFQGQLRAASLNGVPIHATDVIRPTRLLDPQTHSLWVRVSISGQVPPTQRRAIILRLASHLEEGFFLGQWRESVIARTNVVARRFKFRSPLVALEGALSHPGDEAEGATGDAIVDVVSDPRAISVGVDRPDGPTRVTIRRTAGLGWTLLLPWDVAVTPRWWIANASWLAALVFPVGFFTVRSARHAVRSGVSIWWPPALLLGAMIIGPAMFGLSVLSVVEWVGVLAGFFAGATFERMFAADSRPQVNERSPAGTILT